MDEKFATDFYTELKTSANKLKTLADFYLSVFKNNNTLDSKNIYKILAKLYGMYGPDIVFFSILDCYDMENINLKSPYPILAYFAKKRLEESTTVRYSTDLSEFANKNEHMLHRRVNKIIDPFGDN